MGWMVIVGEWVAAASVHGERAITGLIIVALAWVAVLLDWRAIRVVEQQLIKVIGKLRKESDGRREVHFHCVLLV